ncbi:hypothetical protein OLMES_1523 [Oleiphilus messinensis]|uniref:DUF4440 domain-containing protein n=1 Tax=Oleiphilus messinensis TaxID=141451 RepID=A0A1Y0I532_9GAMM|nr:hypothetical protein [Oleiphilus messinensis]ARU55598.1 hypothetical protein OLMES_1523 [Oleiphilus messinensis]
MKRQIKLIIAYVFVLFSAWSTTSCGQVQESNNSGSSSSKENYQVQNFDISETPKTTSKEITFEQFYHQFSTAINTNNWLALADLTKFPFIFRGQLDFEGEVTVDNTEFMKLMPSFLELETFISLEDESFSTTYRVLAVTPMDEANDIEANQAHIHDFVFKKENGHWQFVQIYTDLSNLDLIKE